MLEGGSLRASFSAQDLKSSVALTELDQSEQYNQNKSGTTKGEQEKTDNLPQLSKLKDRKMQSLRRMNSMASLERPEPHKATTGNDPSLGDLPPLKDVPRKLTTPTAQAFALQAHPQGPYYVSQFSKHSFSFLQQKAPVPERDDAYHSSYATMKRKDSLRSVKSLQQ